MKFTKMSKKYNAQFYRDTSAGKFITNGASSTVDNDVTSKIQTEKDYRRSIRDQILLAPKKGNNGRRPRNPNSTIKKLVEYLVGSTVACPDLSELTGLDATEVINNSLSGYGKELCSCIDSPTLSALVENCVNGGDINGEVEKLKNTIHNILKSKNEKQVASVRKNKINYSVDSEGELKPNTPKTKWLFEVVSKLCSTPSMDILEELADQFDYEKFSTALNAVDTNGKSARNIASLVEDISSGYCHTVYKTYTSVGMDFYTREVRAYIKHYFPIKTKNRAGETARQKQLVYRDAKSGMVKVNEKRIERILCADDIKKQVHRSIYNQITATLILYGKLAYYYKKEDGWDSDKLDSKGLMAIQLEEAFKKQLIISIENAIIRLCYFYNYIPEGGGDILLDETHRIKEHTAITTPLDQSKLTNIWAKLSVFFPSLSSTTENVNMALCLLQECVKSAKLRHEIFHYRHGGFQRMIEGLLHDSACSQPGDALCNCPTECERFPCKITSQLLQSDIDNMNMDERLRSTNLHLYYDGNMLNGLLRKIEFKLYTASYPMIPSFRKVYERGRIMQDSHIHTDLKWFFRKGTSEQQLALRNLLALIYKYNFLPEALKEDSNYLERQNIEAFITKSKQQTRDKSPRKYGYEDVWTTIQKLGTDYSHEDLFKALQSKVMQKESENQYMAFKDEDAHNYYQRFIQDLFAHAFDSYLKTNLPQYLPQLECPVHIEKEKWEENLKVLTREIKIKTALSSTNSIHLALYPMLRLLDEKELNRLQHQFIRYRGAMTEFTKDGHEDKSLIENIEELIELVKFTQSSPMDKKYWLANHEELTKFIECFVEGDLSEYGEFYIQIDVEGEHPLILHRSLAMLMRIGVSELYKDMFRDCKITKQHYETLKKGEDCDDTDCDDTGSRIEQMQARRQELHQTHCASKEIDEKNSEIREYIQCVREISEYNHARVDLTFETFYQIYQLHSDLIGRFVGFAQDWERDMLFLLTAMEAEGWFSQNPNSSFVHGKNVATINSVRDIFDRGNVVVKLIGYTKNTVAGKLLEKLYFDLCSEKNAYDIMSIRNNISHLNHYTQKIVNGSFQPSLIETMNRLRNLLAYDEKRQNAVTQVVQEVFDRHGLKLRFKREGEKFVLLSSAQHGPKEMNYPQSKEIQHFAKQTKKIKEAAKSQLFVKMSKQLLVFNKK